jgi:hypothetical protein
VLLQDYRFVLLDAFVRFLANALLAAILSVLVIEAAFRLVLVERVPPEPPKRNGLPNSRTSSTTWRCWLTLMGYTQQ